MFRDAEQSVVGLCVQAAQKDLKDATRSDCIHNNRR